MKNIILSLSVIAILAVPSCGEITAQENNDNKIEVLSSKDFKSKLAGLKDYQLIDVRTPAEYRECHATPARHVPFDSLDPKTIMASRNGSHKAPLYIICQSGTRAQKACEKFYTLGHTQIVNVVGGTQPWQEGDCQ